MIHDYYLRRLLEPQEQDEITSFKEWRNNNSRRLKNKSEEEKIIIWHQEEIIGKGKKKMVYSKDTINPVIFHPGAEDILYLPEDSVLIRINFTLKKPYTSKDEGEFHILDGLYGRIYENPIVRDRFTGLPIVKPSTWKGHLRFAAGMVDDGEFKNNKERIIRRLFGSEACDDNVVKGRLYFYPTFFNNEPKKDVITPLKRDTRTPGHSGSISLEVMDIGKTGVFHLLYFPYPRGDDYDKKQVDEDLEFLARSLEMMFYLYGFSAKKTSGFGIIEGLKATDIEIEPNKYKEIFSIISTKVDDSGDCGGRQ